MPDLFCNDYGLKYGISICIMCITMTCSYPVPHYQSPTSPDNIAVLTCAYIPGHHQAVISSGRGRVTNVGRIGSARHRRLVTDQHLKTRQARPRALNITRTGFFRLLARHLYFFFNFAPFVFRFCFVKVYSIGACRVKMQVYASMLISLCNERLLYVSEKRAGQGEAFHSHPK